MELLRCGFAPSSSMASRFCTGAGARNPTTNLRYSELHAAERTHFWLTNRNSSPGPSGAISWRDFVLDVGCGTGGVLDVLRSACRAPIGGADALLIG